jgi:CubicO group peptidase (beta-lactamase class C family)
MKASLERRIFPQDEGESARSRWAAAALALLGVAGCSARSASPARLASGYVSHLVCSYVFVSGLDPARVDEVDIAGNPVFNGFHWAMRHEVLQADRAVSARTLGGFESRAVYGQTVVVVPSRRLVIARFGTTYDLMMAMVDICRITADTIAAL